MAYFMETILEETESDIEMEEFEFLEYWEDRKENVSEHMEMKRSNGICCLNSEEFEAKEVDQVELEAEEEENVEEMGEFEFLEYWYRKENGFDDINKMELKKWKGISCLNLE